MGTCNLRGAAREYAATRAPPIHEVWGSSSTTLERVPRAFRKGFAWAWML